jgi:hypothetical protein
VLADSCQLVEQRLCVLEGGGVGALGEPAVDRLKHLAGLAPAPLLRPCRASEINDRSSYLRTVWRALPRTLETAFRIYLSLLACAQARQHPKKTPG